MQTAVPTRRVRRGPSHRGRDREREPLVTDVVANEAARVSFCDRGQDSTERGMHELQRDDDDRENAKAVEQRHALETKATKPKSAAPAEIEKTILATVTECP